MKPLWTFAVDNGHEHFKVAIVADAAGMCSTWSDVGGAWCREDAWHPVDIIRPEYEHADWMMTEIAPPADLINALEPIGAEHPRR